MKALIPWYSTKDASQPWPDERKLVDLGVLRLTQVLPNSAQVEQKLLFLPTNLTPGYRTLRRSAAEPARGRLRRLVRAAQPEGHINRPF
jgi:hypothetical protein